MAILNPILQYLNQGGFVCYFLVFIFLVITYTTGYRIAVLFKGRDLSIRKLYNDNTIAKGSIQSNFLNNIRNQNYKNEEHMKGHIDWVIKGIYQEINSFSLILNTAVLLAPLLGLLGTVIGMIETFSSLSSSALYSSTGGIAGGISQALITTQFGLVIAIPGIFLSKYLKKIENKTYMDTIQLRELFLLEKKA